MFNKTEKKPVQQLPWSALRMAKKDEYRAEAIANGVYTPVQPILQPQKGVAAV